MNYFVFVIIFSSMLVANSINIAVSSNMSFVINELKNSFLKQHKDIKIRTTVSSSGKLYATILKGADYDIFVSADTIYPQALFDKNITTHKPKPYATGKLVLFSQKQIKFDKAINHLLDKDVNRIAIANPATAPYGKASLEVLKNTKLYDKVKDKLVYGSSISQTVLYAINSTDMAIINKSAIYTNIFKKYKYNLNYIDIDSSFYTPIKQSAVQINDKESTRLFFDFLFSKEAKALLSKFGYNSL